LVTGNTIHKLLASSGDVRHAIIHARNVDAATPRSLADATDGEWSAKVASYLNHPLDRSLIAMSRFFRDPVITLEVTWGWSAPDVRLWLLADSFTHTKILPLCPRKRTF
jgi:hypothetical protein